MANPVRVGPHVLTRIFWVFLKAFFAWLTAVWMGQRRWDLKFQGGLTVCLPEEHWQQSLEELEKLARDHNIFKREIVMLDCRVSDRLVLGLSTSGIVQTRFHNQKAKKA